METWLIVVIAAMGALASTIVVICCIRKFRQKMTDQDDPEAFRVNLPLSKPPPNSADDGMDPTQREGMQYRCSPEVPNNSRSIQEEAVVDGGKLMDSTRAEDCCSSSKEVNKIDDNEICKERSATQEEMSAPVVNPGNAAASVGPPPPYEETSPAVNRTTGTANPYSLSVAPSGPNAAPGSPNLPRRLNSGSQSPHRFAGPRGETAVPSAISSRISMEKDKTEITGSSVAQVACKSPNANTTTSMAGRSEMEFGVNGEDAGRTPRIGSPMVSASETTGRSFKTGENGSTVFTFTPGSATM